MFFQPDMPTPAPTPRLVMCATLWSMIGWPTPKREWSITEKLRAIAAAGVDGAVAYITPEIRDGADRLGLRLMSGFDCRDLPETVERLRTQRDLGVHFINIQLLNHDTPPARAAARRRKQDSPSGMASDPAPAEGCVQPRFNASGKSTTCASCRAASAMQRSARRKLASLRPPSTSI